MPAQDCECGARYRFPESAIGKRAKCKQCGAVFTLKAEADQGPIPITEDSGMMDDLAAAAERAAAAPARPRPAATTRGIESPGGAAAEAGPVCPSCERPLARSAKICVDCGIDIRTGRSIVTAEETNLDEIYVTAEGVISWISWLFPWGVYPIASEALAGRKPYIIRGIALLTILVSFWFLAYEWTASPRMRSMKNLMLWAGNGEPSDEDLYTFYGLTEFGDSVAFEEKWSEIEESDPKLTPSQAMLAAHKALPREQQYQGQYRTSQLITHAFLHGGILHLVGNLLFMMVFGSRINGLIGNVPMLLVYPLLAIGGGIAHLISVGSHAPVPMVGASGAIMGLAGMYLVFFPVHRMHMAAWARWGLVTGFHLSLRMWSMRGVWVVLFYIAFDVFFTAFGVEDGVAHWAHLGGFGVGVGIALIALMARLVNARGCDIVSATLGKRAWALIGRPRPDEGLLQQLP